MGSNNFGPITYSHLDLDELWEAEDDCEEDGGRDVVHCADDGGAVRREGLVAQRVAHRDVPWKGREVGWIQNADKGNNSGNGHKMPNNLLMLFMDGSEWRYFDVFELVTFAL